MSNKPENTPTSDAPLLRCDQLVVGYRRRALLPPFDLALRRGELTLVIGRNGAGKSTWLKTVLGEVAPVSGSVRVAAGARVSYVPQAATLDDFLPICGAEIAGWGAVRGWGFLRPMMSSDERAARAAALHTAEADAFAHAPFRELSGGQKQRILFARLLASRPDLALLDEPTASMDLAAEQEAYANLRALATERGLAVVVVTHALSVARSFADQVVFFEPRARDEQGLVVAGPPDEVLGHPVFRRQFGGAEGSP